HEPPHAPLALRRRARHLWRRAALRLAVERRAHLAGAPGGMCADRLRRPYREPFADAGDGGVGRRADSRVEGKGMTLRRALVLVLAGLCVVLAARSCIVARDAEAVRAENARLRSEAARARLQASGYETTLAHVTTTLRQTLADRDHWRALAEEPDVAPVAYVRATAEAASRVEGPVEPMDRFTAPDDSIAVGMSPIGDTIPFPGFEGVAADHVFAVR